MIREAAVIFFEMLALVVGVAAVFFVIAAITLFAERQYKRYKKKKRRRQNKQRNRAKQLRRHEADCQFRLARTTWRLEREIIELGNRKTNRQTIYINGNLATPSERAAFLEGVLKNG